MNKIALSSKLIRHCKKKVKTSNDIPVARLKREDRETKSPIFLSEKTQNYIKTKNSANSLKTIKKRV